MRISPSRALLARALATTLVASPLALLGLAGPGVAADPTGGGSGDLIDSAFDGAADAVPAQLLKQPDGTTFRAYLSPAEEGGLFETLDGYSVDRDARGNWRYVEGRDAGGEVVLSEVVVTDAAPPAELVERAGRVTTEVDEDELRVRAQMQEQLRMASLQAQRAAAEAGSPRVFRVPALMLATWYDEAKGQSAPQFQAGHDRDYFSRILDGFGGNPTGSMTQFYYEASFGQFLVEVDVHGVYTSARSIGDPCYYGDGNGELKITDPAGSVLGLGGLGALGMAVEAVPQANVDPEMDWSAYDNDGDGKVDFTMIIHSGGDAAATGNPCYTWSHAMQATLGLGTTAETTLGLPAGSLSRVGIPTSSPGVFVDRVVTIPEYASAADPLAIGVAAHEMAHAIGEPDYYDTSYSSVGTGDFDMMSGGSYLGTPSGSNPAMMNPATRVFQGWVTPKVVTKDLRRYTLKPRTALPSKGYRVGQPDPNLLLVPTYEIKEGETDSLGHTWGPDDVYGLAKNPRTGKYVVEGYYVENVSRNARSVKLHAKNPMGSMFDRRQHGSGLMVWHFDYWRQSTTYFGHSNDAQSDSNRYQMDIEEFDRNDNTQELQLNHSRGNPADYLAAAATGITSGTRSMPPGIPRTTGEPQGPVDISGVSTPAAPGTAEVVVEDNPNNAEMDIAVVSDLAGDCTLSVTDPSGKTSEVADSGFLGAEETLTVKKPAPGTWTVNVGDFAACGTWSGRVVFEGPGGFTTAGAADTWSNWSEKPTGWAFTNVSGYGNGLDVSNEAGGSSAITLDVLNLKGRRDVSPGFVSTKGGGAGAGGLTAGTRNRLTVPVFSNGSKAAGKVQVVVRSGSATGPVVARRTVELGGYQRKAVRFSYRPRQEGPVRLVTVVDPARRVSEASEGNQVQATELWAGPSRAKVLVVDDDQTLGGERSITGALAALGVPYAVTGAHPGAALLKKHRAVIWSASVDRYEGQLDKADRRALRAYLDDGGRLLMTSNRIFDAATTVGSPQASEEGVQFGAQYLGARTPEGNATYVVTQGDVGTVTGTGLLKGQKIKIRPAATRPFVGLAGLTQAGPGSLGTTIAPYGKAFGLGTLDKASMAAVQPATDPAYIAVGVDGDKKHGGFKTVTLGWNLGENVDVSTTTKVLTKVLKRFGVPLRTYRARSSAPLVFHTPVRDQLSGHATTISAVVLDGPAPRLHYRRHGQGGFYSVAMKRGAVKGTWIGTIPARAATPDGIDYYVRSGSTSSAYGASGGPLYHGIAIAMPHVSKPLPIKR